MERNRMNGAGAGLAQYETPFADIPVMKEQTQQDFSTDDFLSNFLQQSESPFSRTYEVTPTNGSLTAAGEEYVNFLAEINDSEFGEVVYSLANEVEDTWRGKVSNEIAMADNYLPFVTQQARNYFRPMVKETERMIDRVSQHFSGNNLADHTESEIESFFDNLDFDHAQYTPVQDQFFGKILSKVKSVVKKGVDLAKKGISIVGKILPINMILGKIKGLINPLLDKVLKFAIGKLPKNLQPHAQTLAKKFLKLETVEEAPAEPMQSENGLDAIQTELDGHIAQLLFAPDESEAGDLVVNYESSYDNLDRFTSYETGNVNVPSLDVARQQFINELKTLQPGESAAPAIERFIPAAIMALQPVIKMALSIIGRQKVINFLAGLLAKLISKFVPANVVQPLAANIIDVGMSAIGFEVNETNKPDVGYEAIANTIQETIQNMEIVSEANLNDQEDITMQLLQSFEKAAANNFPSQYIKEELRPSKQKAVWVAMPRNLPVKLYKKFTHVYDITIEPQTATTVTTFRSLPLANFLKDKYGLDPTKPIKAKVHLYETTKAGRLSLISRFEKLPGLNARQTRAWVQLLPLTSQAASLLLKEPSLGKDMDPKKLASRLRSEAGQRFYYLEIDGARLRIPQVNRSKHKHPVNGQPDAGTESRSADIQGVINFTKSEIKLSYYFSEEDAKLVVEKLNKNDVLGAAVAIRQSIKTVMNDMLLKNVASKIKIVHEAIPELYLEQMPDQEGFDIPDVIGKVAGKQVITKVVEKLVEKFSSKAYEAVVSFFKARAAEFKEAQAQPQDGVTIKLTWSNISGMAAIRTVINAIKGNLSIGNLSDLTVPSFPAPEIKIEADKKFD